MIVPSKLTAAAAVRAISTESEDESDARSITIVSVAVFGSFIGAPAALGLVANNYGVNNVFTPTLIIFILLLFPLIIFRKEFKL